MWLVFGVAVLYLSLAATPYGDEVDFYVGIAVLGLVVILSVSALQEWWNQQQADFGDNARERASLVHKFRRWMHDEN